MADVLEALGAGSLGNLFVRLTADSTALVKGMNEAAESVSRGSTAMLKSAGVMAGGMIALFTGVAVAAVKLADDFEESFLKIQMRMRGSEKDAQQLGDAFRNMSKQIPVNVNEINKVAASALQLGVSKENVVAFTKTMVDFGQVTDESVGEASTQIVRFGELLEVPQKELDKIASTAVRLGFGLKTSSAEVLGMTTQISAAGVAAKMSAQQILGLAAAVTSSGVDAGRGGMAVNKMMQDMSEATKKGGEILKEFAATAGMTADQFTKAYKENATKAILAFLEGLHQIQKRGGDVIDVLDKVGMKGGPIEKTMIRMAGNTELFSKSLAIASDEWEKNTELTRLAGMKYETFHAQLTITWNRVKDFLLTIGIELIPAIKTLNEILQDAIGSTEKYGAANKAANASSEGLLATIGGIANATKFLAVGFLVAKMTIEMAFSGIMTVAGWIAKAAIALIEVPINTAIATANLGIRTFNALGGQMKEIQTRIKFDTSALDLIPKDAAAHAAADFALIEKLLATDFTDKINAAYKKVKDGTKKTGEEVVSEFDKMMKSMVTIDEKTNNEIFRQNRDAANAMAVWAKSLKKLSLPGIGTAEDLDPLLSKALKIKEAYQSQEVKDAQTNLERIGRILKSQVEMDAETKKELLDAQKDYSDKLKELKVAEQKVMIDSGQKIADAMLSMASDMGGKQSAAYMAMFAMTKAFAIAIATINIFKAISDAFKEGSTTAQKLADAAIIMASTATIVSSIMAVKLSFAGGKAMGGPVSPGSTFLVGEQGPELFSPSEHGNIIPNNKLGGSSVRVIVNNYTDVQPRVVERNDGNEKVIEVMLRRVKNEIGGDIRDGVGKVSQAIEKSFGLRRGRA